MTISISTEASQNPTNPLVTKNTAQTIADDAVATVTGTFVALYDDTIVYGAGAIVALVGVHYVTPAGVAAGGGNPDINIANWNEVYNTEYLELWDSGEIYANTNVVLFIDSSDDIAFYRANAATALAESPETTPGKWDRLDPIGLMTLNTAQTVTGIKTFQDTTFVMDSPDATNKATLINPDTAAATTNITLPDTTSTLATVEQVNAAIGLAIALSGD